MIKKWIKTDNIGELYIENILITFDIPLLFVCSNDSKKKFLVLCIDDETEKYLISPIDDADLISMMQDQITMRDAFLLSPNRSRIILELDSKEMKEYEINIQDLDNEVLPDAGIFYNVHNKQNDNYIIRICNDHMNN